MTRTPLSVPRIVAFTSTLLVAGVSAQTCEVQSGPRPPAVVELYTSQGCSSCPPADRWLSTLKTQDKVLALSFHVNYWNHLGWRDPYATPETTARQYRLKEALSGKYVYTPQVVLNGRDHRNWHGQGASSLAGLPATRAPALRMSLKGNVVSAQIAAVPGVEPAGELAGYWAVLQDGLVSRVTRGENAGEDLRNDHVVSLYRPVAPWTAAQGKSFQLILPPGSQQRVAFVVTNPALTQPIQALALKCPA